MSLFTPVEFEPGQRIFVVGDIHGCYEELQELLNIIQLKPEDVIVFLGDYVDRGPYSRKVLERLIQLKKDHSNSYFIRGNHEDMILNFLGYDGHYGSFVIVNGADKFFSDYGLEDFYIWNSKDEVSIKYPHTEETIQSSIPKEHLEFLLETNLALISEEFIFVHAGIDPWENLEHQTAENLCWIREDFINWPHNESRIIVHGHTPAEFPFFDEDGKRINVDTGCYQGGMLSAVELRSEEFFSVPSRQLVDS